MAESIMDQIEDSHLVSGARILVVGVGGGGGNAVKNMIDLGLGGVEFICANTDLQALNSNPAPVHIQLGEKLTRGLGAGSNPDVGREAANESLQAIQQALANADMVFVTAGMGGGTGTGAAPIVAETAKKNGALTVAVVTRPFSYEGRERAENAQAGIDELSKHVDCIITIPNDRIMTLAPKKTPMRELMSKANDVLYYGVKGISDVITCPGYINLDFADVRTCMTESGLALMGMGSGKGENRAEDAVRSAIASPLLEDVSLATAKAILYNITAPEDITGEEMEQIGERLREAVPEEANIVFGVVFDFNLVEFLALILVPMTFTVFVDLLGLLTNLLKPRFDWTNEVNCVKQSLPVAITILTSMAVAMAIVGIYAWLLTEMDINLYIAIVALIFVVVDFLMALALNTWGVKRFETL